VEGAEKRESLYPPVGGRLSLEKGRMVKDPEEKGDFSTHHERKGEFRNPAGGNPPKNEPSPLSKCGGEEAGGLRGRDDDLIMFICKRGGKKFPPSVSLGQKIKEMPSGKRGGHSFPHKKKNFGKRRKEKKKLCVLFLL